MPRRKLFVTVLVGAVCLLGWQGGPKAEPRDEMMELYGVFVDAVEQVESNYVRPVSRGELLRSALRGMLRDLDQHSSFFTKDDWGQFRKQIEGSYTGIGVTVDVDRQSGRLKVAAPLVGSPAYAAGILAGDVILEVDGQSTEGMSHDKAIEALQGRPGTSVTLTILHPNAEKTSTLTVRRAIIDVPSVLGDRRKADDSWDFMIDKDKKIGYVRIASFVQNTTEDVKKALAELKDQGMKGLVLDLRDDPGGLLGAAVEIADLFVEDGSIVTTKGRNTRDKVYEAEEEGTYSDFPMAVLVNQHSASASEIVSACLQDHKRAAVVGQRSYGKGSVQHILPLDNGESVLKLTVATYWRPSGENIHRFSGAKPSDKWGVSPDPGLEVKVEGDDYIAFAKARRARDLLSSHNQPRPPADNPAAEANKEDRPFVDRQLDKALEVVRAKLAEAETK